jgi:Uma2 family endonuclease
MPKVILQRDQFREMLRHRRAMGQDRFDGVWNGVYVTSPDPDSEHQKLPGRFFRAFDEALGDSSEGDVYPTLNISDRDERWDKNYRIPDVSVFLPGNPAKDRGAYWLGGPDFAAEIVSKGDRSRKKFRFYGKVGVRELMILDRRPWRLELHRRASKGWVLAGTSSPDSREILASEVLPLSFRMLPGQPRPAIEVARLDGTRAWTT